MNERIFYLCNPFTRNRANSVTDCNTVCRSKTSTFPRVPCKRKARDTCRYLSVQKHCPAPCKRGFTLRYIELVVVSIYKLLICIEMLPHEGNLIIRNSICQCRTFIWPSGRSTEFRNHRRCQFTNSECCGAHDSSRRVDSNNFFHAVSTRDIAIRSLRESVLTKCENNGSESQQANFLCSLAKILLNQNKTQAATLNIVDLCTFTST